MGEGFFDTSDFMPHGHCYLWNPWLVRLHVGSDMAIGLAYVAISLTLTYLVYQARRNIPFGWMFLLFGTFIIACGGTHFMEVWTLWRPEYWYSGNVKLLTALVSVGTALALPGLIPKALALAEAARLSQERKEKLEKAHGELGIAHQKLQQLDDLKSKFFANVSHELRTPLTLILGPTRKALAGAVNEVERRGLATVERNAVILLKHVNDILDITKLETGKLIPRYVSADLSLLLRATAANFELHAAERGMSLVVQAPLPITAEVDSVKVERILLNLLANAFKFAPDRGRVLCSLRLEGDRASFRVEDDGPGIPAELREAVFERFRQLDAGPSRRYGGTGLGLAIAKEFTEMHGGSLRVSDAPSGGACFTLELPLKAPAGTKVMSETLPPAAETSELARQTLESLKSLPLGPPDPAVDGPDRPLVLIVEDNPEMSRHIAEILGADYSVAAASNGREGLEKARALCPALIMTDLMMPDVSGEDMIEALRADPSLASVPLIVLTARGEEELRLKLLKEGAQDYLLKPFTSEELLARVRNQIALRERTLELARVNEELEAFNYSASHDLRAPLRRLDSFSEILERSHGGALNQEGRAHLARIRTASRTMSRLIDSMLELARITKCELRRAPVNLSVLAKNIVEELRQSEPSRKVRVVIAEGLTARGEEIMLRIALTNLLSNAWKFTARREDAEIEFGQSEKTRERSFFIADNGVGFEGAYTGKLFVAFSKLHRPDEFAGSGIGLATVKRVIERHAGRVWAEGEVGRGATFYFTLP